MKYTNSQEVETMRELITICKQKEDRLSVIGEEYMITNIDENKMEVFVIYKKKRYTVQGNIYMYFIVI